MPEMVETSRVTLRRQWTDMATKIHGLRLILPAGVRVVDTEEDVVLESENPSDLCLAVSAIKRSVVDHLVAQNSSENNQSNRLEKTAAHEHREKECDKKGIQGDKENAANVKDENCKQAERNRMENDSMHDDKQKQAHDTSSQPPNVASQSTQHRGSSAPSVADERRLTGEFAQTRTDEALGMKPTAPTSGKAPQSATGEQRKESQDNADETNISSHETEFSDKQQEKYLLDESLWAFITFSDLQWKGKFTARRIASNGDEVVELSGYSADIEALKQFCDKRRLHRAVTRKVQRVPERCTAKTFQYHLEKLSKGTVLVRSVKDPKYCEVVGKNSDLAELQQLIDVHYPELPGAKNAADNKQPMEAVKTASPVDSTRTVSSSAYHDASQAARTRVSAEEKLEFHTPMSKVRVALMTGDLLKQRCEILVNPSNSFLDNAFGLSLSLAQAAGIEMQLECHNYLSQWRELPVSHVMDTTSGKISPPVRRIIHACGPSLYRSSDQRRCHELLEQTFFNCFVFANDKQHACSIAVPAIGSGVCNIPSSMVANAAYEALMRFDSHLSASQNKYLRDICFVNIKAEVTTCMIETFKRALEQSSPWPNSIVKGVTHNTSISSGSPLRSQYTTQLDYTKMERLAKEKGFALVDVPVDGDCALHAVVRQLQQEGISFWDVRTLRRLAVDNLDSQPELINYNMLRKCYHGNVTPYLSQLRMPGTLCDDAMLHAVATVTGRNIHLLDDNGAPTKFEPLGPSCGDKVISLGRIGGTHCVSLEPCVTPGNGQSDRRYSTKSAAFTESSAASQPREGHKDGEEILQYSYNKLKTEAKKRRFSLVDVPLSGDSALHAVIRQLQLQGIRLYDLETLRKRAVDYLCDHTSLISKNISEAQSYLTAHAISGAYCDEIMLTAVSEVIGKEIFILHEDGQMTKHGLERSQSQPVTIGVYAKVHYASLEPLNSKQTCKPHNDDTTGPGRSTALDRNKAVLQHTAVNIDFNKMNSVAKQYGLTIADVPWDAHNAFSVIIDQLKRQGSVDYDAVTLRSRAVSFLQSHPQPRDSNFVMSSAGGNPRTYEKLETSEAWCSEALLQAVSEVIGKEVHIFHDTGRCTKIKCRSTTPIGDPVLAGLIGEVHYVSLVRITSLSAADVANHSSLVVSSTSDSCAICMDVIKDPKTLPCNHVFCSGCISQSLAYQPKCPCCGKIFGTLKGDQPEGGNMFVKREKWRHLEGYPGCGSIVIDYFIPDGQQKENHPNPGKWYRGAHRTAYLPGNAEGEEICSLLRRAFDAGLIFTVGTSTTSGRENVVTWNDIHHKTKPNGPFGYPDPTYLARVRDELAAKGITSEELKQHSASSSAASATSSSSSSTYMQTFSSGTSSGHYVSSMTFSSPVSSPASLFAAAGASGNPVKTAARGIYPDLTTSRLLMSSTTIAGSSLSSSLTAGSTTSGNSSYISSTMSSYRSTSGVLPSVTKLKENYSGTSV